MPKGRPLPSVILCAIGFAAAGSGLGSLVGSFLYLWLLREPPPAQLDDHRRIMPRYDGTLWGIVIGIGLGAVAGVMYAIAVRRARRRVS